MSSAVNAGVPATGNPGAWYRQPVMWIVVALPLLALLGGVLMVALTAATPDLEVHSERLRERPAVDAP